MLDWSDYDAFDWAAASQAPMAGAERDEVEALAAELLELPKDGRASCWGSCSPPGRFAATVIRVTTPLPPRYRLLADEKSIAEVGVKVFKSTSDARREGDRAVRFSHQLQRLPGLPNEHVQRVLAAGNRARHYLIQEWVAGSSLEDLVRRTWPEQPPGAGVVRSILEQLFGKIVIPLWSAGTIWWDFRDANYCWDESTGRLAMIDVDSLSAYADEILGSPQTWARRKKGRQTALPRLRQMALRLVLSQGVGPRARIERGFKEVWGRTLEPTLQVLGRKEGCEADASLQAFLASLHEVKWLK
jgi:hypothetical protein